MDTTIPVSYTHLLRREFSYSKFEQALILPEDVVKEKISANASNGVPVSYTHLDVYKRQSFCIRVLLNAIYKFPFYMLQARDACDMGISIAFELPVR